MRGNRRERALQMGVRRRGWMGEGVGELGEMESRRGMACKGR